MRQKETQQPSGKGEQQRSYQRAKPNIAPGNVHAKASARHAQFFQFSLNALRKTFNVIEKLKEQVRNVE